MRSRALKHPRFGRLFGFIRRKTSSRRGHIALVRQLYRQTDLVHDGCICCGGTGFDLLAECDRYGFDLKKQICRQCGLVQTYPALSASFLKEFYRDHYRRLYTKSEKVNYSLLTAEQSERGSRFISFLKETIPDGDISEHHVVEIGCSAGGILKEFKGHVKSVMGCDLDEAAINYAREVYELNVEVAEFPRELPNGSRVFLLSHVLEHIAKPKELLMRIREEMTSDDYLLIEVPGLNMVAQGAYGNNLRSYFHIAHVADFTSSTLSLMLKICGLKAVNINENVTGLFVKSSTADLNWHKSGTDTVENVLRIERTFRLLK